MIRHQLCGFGRALLLLEARLVELDARRETGRAVDCRHHDVVQVGLLVGVCEVGLRRPSRVRQKGHRLRVVRELVDPSVELLQHPCSRVAGLHVLHVQHPRIDERVVGLHDERVVPVDGLEDGVRVGEPNGVGVQVQHVEAVREDQSLQKDLAGLEEGQRHLVKHGVVQRRRPRRRQPAGPPDAGERWHGVPQADAYLLLQRQNQHMVQTH
mmetsp:Transcript_30481/g.98467  ORF Transcript_30481/g.98467 Transcript_30481/m.98467 type:complete len:211 (+) Transcript_30481:1464-2096(+)